MMFVKGLAFGFILAATFGLTAISGVLLGYRFWIELVGAVFLLYLGSKILLARPVEKSNENSGKSLVAAFLSTLGLTLTNPPTPTTAPPRGSSSAYFSARRRGG